MRLLILLWIKRKKKFYLYLRKLEYFLQTTRENSVGKVNSIHFVKKFLKTSNLKANTEVMMKRGSAYVMTLSHKSAKSVDKD